MCYIVAKDARQLGCVAFKTTHGKHLTHLKRRIEEQVGYEHIQLVTISRPSAYGEYAPYHFVTTEEDFEQAAISLLRVRA